MDQAKSEKVSPETNTSVADLVQLQFVSLDNCRYVAGDRIPKSACIVFFKRI